MEIIQSMDFAVLDFIRENFRCAFLDTVMPAVTSLGNGGKFWVLLTVVLLIIPKTRTVGKVSAVSLLICFLVTNVTIKPLAARVRPYDINTAVELIVKAPSDFSFPSGHTSIAFAGASSIFFCNKKAGIPFLVLAAVIGLSRLYLYVHFPTDVIAGAVIGTAAGYAGYRIIAGRSSKRIS
ncbi:MAG: phosphatase PAP2 family protein [Bacillota bacterium]|nr:phosphatase PAP2 family protein [Bacillota bacterium]